MIFDAAIIGGGIFGLTLTRALAAQGKSVLLLEKDRVGAGASGGLLGALMPASPLANGPLPCLQRFALSHYADDIAQLEAETKLPTGYRRTGRLQHLPHNHAEQLAASDTLTFLPDLNERFPQLAEQLTPHPQGYLFDNSTAQVTPRLLLQALKASVESKIKLHEKTDVTRTVPGAVVAIETSQGAYQARRVIVTAGWQCASLTNAPMKAVKGHALALDPIATQLPLIYGRDLYIVFHDHMTALGSTTEKDWRDTNVDPAQIDLIQQRAAEVMPATLQQPIIESWCGMRPRGPHALPYIQMTQENVITATGGYKVGLALGFTVARLLADEKAPLENTENFWNWANATHKMGLFPYA